MELPSPDLVVWFLGAFLTGWAASLIWRGLSARIIRSRRACPACAAEMPPSVGLSCAACLNIAESEADLFRRKVSHKHVWPGAALVLVGLAVFVMGFYVQDWVWGGGRAITQSTSPWHGAGLGLAAFAIALGIWAVRGDTSRGRRRCPKCWYEIRVSGLTCSECGHTAGGESDYYRSRRRRGAMIAAALLLLLAGTSLVVPRVRRGGWVGLIPTTAMIAGIGVLPDSVIGPSPTAPLTRFGDDLTLGGRLSSGGMWEWQRAWLDRRIFESLLSADSTAKASRACRLIQSLGKEQVQRLANAGDVLLSSDDPAEFARGVLYLGLISRHGHAVTPHLDATRLGRIARLLSGTDLDVATSAAQLLGSSGEAGRPFIPDLLRLTTAPVTGGSATLVWTAIQSVGKILKATPGGFEGLLDAVAHPDPQVAIGAVYSLQYLGGNQSLMAEVCIKGFAHPDPKVASTVMQLGGWFQFGDQADRTRIAWAGLDQVKVRTEHREIFVPNAEYFRGAIIPLLPDLSALLSDPDPAVAAAAASSISFTVSLFPQACSDILPGLEAAKPHPSPEVAKLISHAIDTLRAELRRSQAPPADPPEGPPR